MPMKVRPAGETYSALGRETLPISNSAVGLAGVPDRAQVALIQVETSAVRMDIADTPTSSQGIQLFPGEIYEVSTRDDLDSVQFIRVSADASLEVIYFG